jgi:hypothetical protein
MLIFDLSFSTVPVIVRTLLLGPVGNLATHYLYLDVPDLVTESVLSVVYKARAK